MRLRRAFVQLALAGAVLLAACGPASAPPSSKSSPQPAALAIPDMPADWRGDIDYRAFDARIRQMMNDQSLTGLAVAVVEQGRLAFVHGYGQTAAEGGAPVDARTAFRWASLSKTVAATLTARLAADGALSLSAPVADFDTTLRLPGGTERSLPLEMLLSQQTGLPRNAFDDRLEAGEDPRQIRAELAGVAQECPPGTCHSYQNIAYDAVSEAVAHAAGQPYAELVRARLFEPLGMTGASLGPEGLKATGDWARPTRGGRDLPFLETYYRLPAAAGVNSSVVDLARWMQAQMGLAPQVLPAPVLSEIQSPRVNTGPVYGRSPFGRRLTRPAYGLGMRSFAYEGHRLLGHSGAVSGYRSTMMFDPATKTGIVMLWNSDSGLPFKLQAEFLDLAYHRPFEDWLGLDPRTAKTPEEAGARQPPPA